MILLSLHPGSLTKIIQEMHPHSPMQRTVTVTIDRFEDFWVEYPVHVISVAVVQRCIFILVFFVL